MTDSTHGADDSTEQEIVLEVACNVTDTLEQAVELGEEDLLRVALLTLERVQIEESVEISLLVTDDDGLRELNREFRGRDEATDVLSFPLLDTPLVEAPTDELWQPDEDAAVDAGDTGVDGRGSWPSSDGQRADDADNEDESDEDDEDTPLHLGDIAISRDAVVRQFAHGLLHLMGYDDSTDAGYQAMVAHQEAVLTEAHITR
jgi:probable rRNA maturation factor